MDALTVEAAEERRRAGAVETLVVIEDPDLQDAAAPKNRLRRSAGRESLSLPGRCEVSSQEPSHSFGLGEWEISVDAAGVRAGA
jgi:hypothetical protein